eukprot:SAG31_NODE_2109_length_6426_cov_13.928244_6_plen_110_part_00
MSVPGPRASPSDRSLSECHLLFHLLSAIYCSIYCCVVPALPDEFFAKRQLVTVFSAPNYCGEFDNAGAMMTVDETLMCSFQVLKPADKKTRFANSGKRPVTPPRGTWGS